MQNLTRFGINIHIRTITTITHNGITQPELHGGGTISGDDDIMYILGEYFI
jgi:hypothetical protein